MALIADDEDDNVTPGIEPEEVDLNEQEEEQETSTEEDGEEEGGEKLRPSNKPSRKEERSRRYEEHKEITALRETVSTLNRTIEGMARSQTAATEQLARTAEGMGKPPAPTLEDRQAKELQDAADKIKPATEDPTGATMKQYFKDVAVINAKYTREIAEDTRRETVREVRQSTPVAPTPEMQAVLMAAPWMKDRRHNAAVQIQMETIAKTKNINLETAPDNVWNAVLRQGIVRHANAHGLETSYKPSSNGESQRQSPAVGGNARGTMSGSGGGGDKTPNVASDPQFEMMRRHANEHPRYKKIADPVKRYSKYFNEIVKGELPT